MKTAVLLALLVAVALAAAWFVFSRPAYPLTQADAQKYFLDDLQQKYPNADVREITDIRPLTAPDGSPYYELQARVTNGLYTPCPERINIYYDYPPKNFVAQQPEYITRGCQVCLNVNVCTIAFPEEAIIASHTYNGTEAVAQFILSNSDAKAQASFDGNDTWAVSWASASTANGYVVQVSKSQNRVLSVTQTLP